MNEIITKAMTEGPEEWDLLNDRQKELAESYTETALKFGMFNQSSLADGAHYAPAAVNPFKASGMICSNCVFFSEEANQCMIVEGILEPEAICKLWVIPEQYISEPGHPATAAEVEEPAMKMNKWNDTPFNLQKFRGVN